MPKRNRNMKYWDGYLCRDKDLEELPVGILEDVIVRIYEDSYLSRDSKRDLLKVYLEQRKWKLDKEFQYTEENLQRLREMNELIERQSIDAIRAAYRIYREELEVKAERPEEYVDVEVRPQLKVPSALYYDEPGFIFTEKEERVWYALCSLYNSGYETFGMLPGGAFFCTSRPDESCEVAIRDWVYGCHGDEEPTSWGDVMHLDREKVKDICFVWPFHNIYDFCGFAMEDLLKIKKFDLVIELTDEVL